MIAMFFLFIMGSELLGLFVEMGTTDTAKMTITDNDLVATASLGGLADEVQDLVGEISEHFVPQPSDEMRTVDAIEGISDFKMHCHWAEFWCNCNKERFEMEQKVWAAYYRDHPDKLKTKDWEKANDDPNWIWPNPSTGKSYDEELEDMINVLGETAYA